MVKNKRPLRSRSCPPANPNPTLFERREASEPYSRGQWDSALKATPHSPKGDVSYVRALEPTARSGAHSLRSRHPRSLLTVLNYCRIRAKSPIEASQPLSRWRQLMTQGAPISKP